MQRVNFEKERSIIPTKFNLVLSRAEIIHAITKF